MSIRKRIEKSERLAAVLSGLLAGYLRFVRRTGKWAGSGIDDLLAELENGPVIIVCWHQRLILAPLVWPADPPNAVVPRDPSPAGMLSAHTQARLGTEPVVMNPKNSALANMRLVLKRVRAGKSLGLTADGPNGPARQARQAVIDWARATGCPVYLFAWSGRRTIRLGSWDRLMIPLPFSRCVYGYRRWDRDIPKRATEDEAAAIRSELSAELDRLTEEMDARTGG